MNISDEAVEAAARALWFAGRDGQEWLPGDDPLCDMITDEARAALEAAAPHLMAPVLELADKWQEEFPHKANLLRETIRSSGAGE